MTEHARLSSCPHELVDLARRVVEANRAAGRRIAVAESCTGGLVAAALTEIAGSSDVFEAGFVTYSNEAKTKLLGVSEDVIETFGAVSVAVAWAMAQGALDDSRRRRRGRAHRHRRARPAASDRKPVGTVVFARAERDADPEGDRRRHASSSATSAAAASAFRRRCARSSCCCPDSPAP